MRRAGIDSTRVLISWAEVEANRGEYDWSRPDALIQDVSAEGLGASALFGPRLGGTGRRPRVLRRRLHRVRTRLHGDAHRVRRLRSRGGPALRARWSLLVAAPFDRGAADARLAGLERAELDAFFRPEADPDAYAELLAPAAEKIRAEDPDAEILIGGMFGPRDRPTLIKATRYLSALYHDRRVAGSFDGVAVHPYSGSALGSLAQVRAVLRTIRRRGRARSSG